MPAAEPEPVTPELLRRWPLPEPGDDKQSRGTILVVGGSAQTPGAVLLAGEAAVRAGAGRLQVATAESVVASLAVAVPESLVVALPEDADGAVSPAAAELVVSEAAGVSTVLLGPGLRGVEVTVELLRRVVPALGGTVVLDALASAYVTEHPDGLRHLEGRCVLTVNPTELARVLGRSEDEVGSDLPTATRAAAARTGAVVLCGGRVKTIATPDGKDWVVRAGGPGLGVSGSGDVNAGVVAGLAARGAGAAQAAVWGGYLHARSGERLARSVGPVGFLARELLGEVPPLLAELSGGGA